MHKLRHAIALGAFVLGLRHALTMRVFVHLGNLGNLGNFLGNQAARAIKGLSAIAPRTGNNL